MKIDIATKTLQILVVGDHRHVDFQAPLAFLDDVATVHCHTDLQAVLRAEDDTLRNVDLIVLTQSRPGQISLATVDALHQLWPLALMVGILGSWCEGEMRSGQPWPGVVRVYWHQWQTMLAAEVEAMLPARSSWQRPRIMQQTWEATTDVADTSLPSTLNVLVSARQPATCAALVDGLVHCGAHVWLAAALPPTVKPAAVVYDAEYVDRWMLREIAALKRMFSEPPLLALLSFPRRDDVAATLEAGAWQVMSKPYRLSDVVTCLKGLHLATGQEAPRRVSGRAG